MCGFLLGTRKRNIKNKKNKTSYEKKANRGRDDCKEEESTRAVTQWKNSKRKKNNFYGLKKEKENQI